MRARFAAAILAGVLAAVAVEGQQPAPSPGPSFRVEVNYVEVDAAVTDAQGNPVTNLTAADFEVLEDGRPQKVTNFSLVHLAIERAVRPLFAAQPIEADVQTNEQTEGRIYLIVLDDLHVEPSRNLRVKTAVRRFLEQNFGTNDLAAIAYTSGRANDAQEFTNNTRLLLRAVDRFTGRKLPSSTVEQLAGLKSNPDGIGMVAGTDAFKEERPFRARNVMNTVRTLADFMGGVRGRRKAMILVSEGVDYDIFAATGLDGSTASVVISDTHDAIAAATRGNVVIYGVDPRGLASGTEDLIGVSSILSDPDPEKSLGTQSIMGEQSRSQDSLRVLASATGGFAAVNRNDLNTAFDRIVSENSSYYLLGFYPANDRRNGRFRKLEVRVKRPGLHVRSRSGYYEPRGRAPNTPARPATAVAPAIADALGSPIPIAGVPVKVFAAAFKGAAPNASVAITIELDVNRLDFVEKEGTFNERLEVAYAALDVNGKVFPGSTHTVNLAMKPDTFARVKARGFRVLTKMDLPPGRYQLRVAAGNATGKVGTVLYDVEVPDFSKSPLGMSGVALTARSAQEVVTMKPMDPLAEMLPAPPTAAREFARGDILALFAEFYENMPNTPPHTLDFRAELRAEGGQVVQSASDERSSTELTGPSTGAQGAPKGRGIGGYGFNAQLSLADVEPGLYVLHVEGRSHQGAAPNVSRDIQIRIR
jgi:VWFA-related protein